MDLTTFFKRYDRCAIAFSGGTDSAYLLYAAAQCGADVRAYFIKSAFQPAFERRDAEAFSQSLGVPLSEIVVDVLHDPQIRRNDAERCYFCKRALFSAVIARAAADGYSVVLDGTNASDDAGDRPGMRALRELNVLSPLRLCGLTKTEIRRLSKEAGLFTAEKPAYACLATRIPTGTPITADALCRVEAAENAMFQAGFSDFRVRVREGGALVQLTQRDLLRCAGREAELNALLAPWFSAVRIDETPREGA